VVTWPKYNKSMVRRSEVVILNFNVIKNLDNELGKINAEINYVKRVIADGAYNDSKENFRYLFD
jgi:hypothetical protein